MDSLETIFTAKNVRKIWKKLRDSEVPIVSDRDYADVSIFSQSIFNKIRTNEYIPSLGHGYLGYPKNAGCTRFVPVLSKEDIAVYYLLVLSLEDWLVYNIDGVYGGWRVVPGAAQNKKMADDFRQRGLAVVDPYFSNTFSKAGWFRDWRKFTDLLDEMTGRQGAVGNYVIKTDIANFYDTIDISSLHRKILSVSPNGNEEIIELLKFFLQHWDRRIKGYSPSSMGIPQDIIQDASRILAHFFLKDFDEEFKKFCDESDIIYTRWADDITLFGKSEKQLELAIHRCSKLLLKIGLNLNASKTMLFSKRRFRDYRALDFLQSVQNNDRKAVERQLTRIETISRNTPVRMDTVFRGTLSYVFNDRLALTPYVENFVNECSRRYEYFSQLNASGYNKLFNIARDKPERINEDIKLLMRKPYATARANYLHFFRKYSTNLVKNGVPERKQINLVNKIKNGSKDSTLISNFCAPATEERISKRLSNKAPLKPSKPRSNKRAGL